MTQTIRGRILLLLALMSAAAGLSLFVIKTMQQRQLTGALATRAAEFREQIERTIELFDATQVSHTFDYTYWDEMVDLVSSHDEQWARDNIESSINTMGVNAAWVLDTSFEMAYATAHGMPQPQDKDLPAALDKERLSPFLARQPFRHFFVNDARGLLEFRTAPIQPTADNERKTAPQGYYLTAKLWDKSYLERVGTFLGSSVWSSADMNQQDNAHEDAGHVLVRLPLPGLDGKPVGWLYAHHDFTPVEQWHRYLNQQLVVFVLLGIALFAALYLALSRLVNRPLQMISGALMGNHSAIRELEATGTEFSAIATLLQESRAQRLELEMENQRRKRLQNELEHLANHDPLTGLANRNLFTHSLNQLLIEPLPPGSRIAVFYIDLDRFKNVNDMHGHSLGDRLLCIVAEVLRQCVGEGDLAARIGGDEFLLYSGPFSTIDEVVELARHLLKALSVPLRVDNNETFTAASIGVSVFPDHGDDAARLISHADQAMYRVKQSGRNGYKLVDQELMDEEFQRISIEAQLRHVLERDELHLHYQPRMDRRTGEIVAVEALLRWTHPVRGNISPDIFIPLAEENGLILPIGLWVLRQACRQQVSWQQERLGALRVAVNLSAKQLRSPSLAEDILSIVGETGMDPHLLELELTESALDTNHTATAAFMNSLAERGIRFAIDDFGVGFSSLGYLKDLPVNTLKIDRSFVRGAETNPAQSRLVAGITSMAHGLGLMVVAEGIENAEQVELVSAHGCDELQGFLVSRPLPASQIVSFVGSASERPLNFRTNRHRA